MECEARLRLERELAQAIDDLVEVLGKNEAEERLILFGESSLRTAVQNFTGHYDNEPRHQGLSNRLITPESDHLVNTGAVQRRKRLGGTLNYYYRAAA